MRLENEEILSEDPNTEMKDEWSGFRFKRKNSMKNKPCPCNSGKKFKACCWYKFQNFTITKPVGQFVVPRGR